MPNIYQVAMFNAQRHPGKVAVSDERQALPFGQLCVRAQEVVTDARCCIPAVAFADICAVGDSRLQQSLQDIHCPVVIVDGSEDWFVPPEFAREVERVLQKGKVPVEYIEWPSIGHFSQSECSEPFTRDTLAAMRRQSL
ncbi:alpha/beta fold hydrolase [Alcaligenes sp.]|uniref:alpha/beta fold hydrolase n=1 Tax=Alcaligenes sp. TaxID=512 RepID=UPI003D054FF5